MRRWIFRHCLNTAVQTAREQFIYSNTWVSVQRGNSIKAFFRDCFYDFLGEFFIFSLDIRPFCGKSLRLQGWLHLWLVFFFFFSQAVFLSVMGWIITFRQLQADARETSSPGAELDSLGVSVSTRSDVLAEIERHMVGARLLWKSNSVFWAYWWNCVWFNWWRISEIVVIDDLLTSTSYKEHLCVCVCVHINPIV